MRWFGDWEFRNISDSKNGRHGTTTVSAPTETKAKEAIRKAASRELFETAAMQRYVRTAPDTRGRFLFRPGN